MANVPVTGSDPSSATAPAPVPAAGRPAPSDSRYGDAAAGPLFATPEALRRLTPDGGTHSLTAGYLLWILAPLSALVGAGMHRFYYGKKWTGLLWTLTFGVFGIGWIVDFFLMPKLEAHADRRYVDGPYDYNIAWILNALPLLGVFGVHRFYLGKWISGILWLVTVGLFGFGWAWDLFTLNEQVDARNRAALGDGPRPEGEGVLGVGW